MIEDHDEHWVQTRLGVFVRFMRWQSFIAVSAATMRTADDFESACHWQEKAVREGIVFG
jgi:hypothetical protein